MTEKFDFDLDSVLKKNNGVLAIKTEEGVIISRADLKDDSIYYFDDPVSFKIWELLDGKNSLIKIKSALLAEYDVRGKELGQDLDKFIQDLYSKNLIISA